MDNIKIEIDVSKTIAHSDIVTIKHNKGLEKRKATNRKANIQIIVRDIPPDSAKVW